MLSTSQAETMLSLQGAMNSKVDPNWVAAKYPYLRAVVIEGSEAIEHHGWKWWKKQDKDLAQLQMELIDIWHFILSELLLESEGDEAICLASLMELLSNTQGQSTIEFDTTSYQLDQLDLISKLELLIALSASRRIELAVFAAIMRDCEMNWTDLYCQYVGKNVLNFFRQDHGYKEGHYQKIWKGREDNEYLVDIMAELDPADDDYKDKVYSALATHYPS
ncbi:MAG: dUTP diphosphatase [SAR86 cluster bacterium]|uniref:dUTP diphosphatase n=1 Tax=SAR86 cluster bacterium TaxID=2030880 RepID=A0A2A5BA98_9GAMM|nr:MAG: dUTP diphosphatase [SAR86 cluster bacterium]